MEKKSTTYPYPVYEFRDREELKKIKIPSSEYRCATQYSEKGKILHAF